MKQEITGRVRAILSAGILATAFAAEGAVWNTETVHSWSGRDIGKECDLVLDSSGYPHISYVVTKQTMPFEKVLYYAAWNGSSWKLEQVYTNMNGASKDTAISLSGSVPTVSEVDDVYNYSDRSGARTHTKTGGTWSNTQLDDLATGALSAIPAGITYTAWADRDHMPGAVNLWFNSTKVDGNAPGGTSAGEGADCVQNGSTIGICYFSEEDGGVLKLAEDTGIGYTNEVATPMTGGSPVFIGLRSALAYDEDGNPHIVYTDTSVSPTMLGHAWKTGGIWHTQHLARCGVGSVSIDFDSKKRMNVLYQDYTVSGLAHGVGNGTDWRFMKIATCYAYSAFAIDATNGLHAAYRVGGTADRLGYALGAFVSSNLLLNGQFDSDSEAWNFGDIEGGEGVIFGSIYQITDPADPSNKVCRIHAHNEWGNNECAAWLEQEIDVADRMQWLEFDYRFLDSGTHFEVELTTDWKDSNGILRTLPGSEMPDGEFYRCGIPLPFNRQDAKDATLHIRFEGGPNEDYYALLDNIELVVSGSPRLEKSTGKIVVSTGQGTSPPNTTFEIWNTGTNDLAYSLSSDAAWFSLTDPSGMLTGQVETVEVEFSSASLAVGSYTGELAIAATGVSTQTVSVVLSIVPPPVSIATAALPDGEVGTAYSFQLEATNGTPPYVWQSAISGYTESSAANSFANVGSGQGWWDHNATWKLDLPFAFPFYGQSHSACWVDSNGRITFGDVGSYDYPDETVFTNTSMIAVLWDSLNPYDIYVESSASQVTIRWRGGYVGGSTINASLVLADNGTITMKYGSGNAWGGGIGISAGDGSNYLHSTKHDSGGMDNAVDILFVPWAVLPDGLALSTNGLLSGTPTAVFSNDVGFIVVDQAGDFDTRWLGLLIADESSGDADGDGIPDWWEILYFGGPTNCVATNHNDGDVFDNLAEYIAGSDPTNSGSFFRITNETATASGFVVEWDPCIGGRWYSVDWTNKLSNGFQSLETGIDFPQNSYTDTAHSAEDTGFYRVEVQLK